MTIEKVAEHLIDLELLPIKAKILDLGCVGFIFTNEMRRLGHSVYPVDIQHLDALYYRIAITGYNGYGYVINNVDRQAVKFAIEEPRNPKPGETYRVECMTLESFMSIHHVDFFDYIKCDVEGSEFAIIMSLKKAPSKQFECEFHLHTGAYNEDAVIIMVEKMKSLGYEVASHEKTSEHGCGMNYWSSLFILK